MSSLFYILLICCNVVGSVCLVFYKELLLLHYLLFSRISIALLYEDVVSARRNTVFRLAYFEGRQISTSYASNQVLLLSFPMWGLPNQPIGLAINAPI